MRKSITLLILSVAFIAILLSGCDSLNVSEELTTDNNDKIISTIEKSSPITEGNLITKTNTDDEGNISVEYYDSVGNLVESYLWGTNDEIISHSVITYTADNNIQQKEELLPDGSSSTIETYQYNSDGKFAIKTVSEYDKGKLSKSTTYDANGNATGYSVSDYNDKDFLSRIERYNTDDTLQEYYLYEYNDQGQTIKYSAYKADDTLIRYTVFEYNDKNLLSSEKYYNSDEKLESYYEFTYYDNGNTKSSIYYDADGNIKSEDYFENIGE